MDTWKMPMNEEPLSSLPCALHYCSSSASFPNEDISLISIMFMKTCTPGLMLYHGTVFTPLISTHCSSAKCFQDLPHCVDYSPGLLSVYQNVISKQPHVHYQEI